MDDTITKFMQYDYKEVKDLSTQFITLITAVLIFSLTFSEKVVEFKNAQQPIRNLLLISWSLFLASIVGCGLCLVLNTYAASEMLYNEGQQSNAFMASHYSALSLLGAGCMFVIGLVLLIVAGFLGRHPSEPARANLAQIDRQELET